MWVSGVGGWESVEWGGGVPLRSVRAPESGAPRTRMRRGCFISWDSMGLVVGWGKGGCGVSGVLAGGVWDLLVVGLTNCLRD